jgi:hypothetical protein
MADKIEFKSHPLVEKLQPDPDHSRHLVTLVGYVGQSKKADYIRLYTDLSFRRYYEIPTSGITHVEPSDTKAENSPTTVLVVSDTKLEVVETASLTLEASYLQGDIATGYLAGSDWGQILSNPAGVDVPIAGTGMYFCSPHRTVPCATRPICTNRLRCPM